jgi:lipopolysaccharide export system protein LptA
MALSIFFHTNTVFAQKTTQVEIVNADTFEGDESLGKNVSRLNGDVRFRHQGAMMYCDSAYLYQETNSLDAFGKIRIEQGDSINLTGDFLKYEGNSRLATITGNVVMTDRDMTLRSTILKYQMANETAEYFNGGELRDKTNLLTSRKGKYLSKDKMVLFSDSVVLINPQYSIRADSLRYQTNSRVALFSGPTRIYSSGSDSSMIYCESGWYNTVTEKSFFSGNPAIYSKETTLTADSLWYDNNTATGLARKKVTVSDTVQRVIIMGELGVTDNKNRIGWVTDRAQLIRIFENDSLYLHADTLRATEDTITGNKSWVAYHGVRVFKSDMQGKCDSLVYTSSDSLITFHQDPVLWNGENQLTADLIQMLVAGSQVSEMRMFNNAFIVSREDTLRFNQIKGRDMTGNFLEGKLNTINVEGNGQSVYYTRNSKNQFTGVNRADCSDMLITINDENKVSSITLINEPDAVLYPIDELSPSELRLKGFYWSESDRPKDRNDIFRKMR